MKMNDNNLISDEVTDYIDDRLAQRFSEALMFNLHIPMGIHLVASIGSGNEEDNQKAIKNWVSKQFQEFDLNTIDVQKTLVDLEERLSSKLVEVQSRNIHH